LSASNADIAAVLDEIADILTLQDANAFRIRAYRNAAQLIDEWPKPLSEWAGSGRMVGDLPGIGVDLAAKIGEILQTGTCTTLLELRREVPAGVIELLRVPGLGPKRVQILHRQIGVSSPQHLLRAAQEGQVRSVQGFGPASEQRIVEAVSKYLRNAETPARNGRPPPPEQQAADGTPATPVDSR
jgi:DNA polymerase (family 10)